ncbi:MAG: type II secretion system protein [Phycisphaerae bacterium]|jgi:type II secretory pathway pseudopilin PulG
MTLVEVLAGSALLGILLVAIVVANARLTAQTRRAADHVEAAEAAEGLLQYLWMDRDAFPRTGGGDVPGHPGWSWRAMRIDNADVATLGGEAVSVEVFSPGESNQVPSARVELALPPAKKNRQGLDPNTATSNPAITRATAWQ